MNPSHSPWSEFAATVFSADEEKRRHAFLSRNALLFLSATELPVIATRLCQSAIPEVADVCVLNLHRSSEETPDQVFSAYRYGNDREAIERLRTGRPLAEARTLMEATSTGGVPHLLSIEELRKLEELLPDLKIVSAATMAVGSAEQLQGYCLFLMTGSERKFSESRLRLVRDLVGFGEQAILRARSSEHMKNEVETREKMISIASHEMKTPLTTLQLQIDLLQRTLRHKGTLDPKNLDESFRTLNRTIQKLTQSVGMLFNLSEIQTGNMTVLKEPADLSAVLRDVIARMDSLMRNSGCQIFTEIPAETPGFFDPRRIEQAVVNLLANSAKYAPNCRVGVTLVVKDDWASLNVSDNGPGVPDEDHARIFEAFQRSSDGSAEGLGLGLFVARSVIQAHGGRLSLISGPGEGARFQLEFPLWQA